MDKSNQIIIYVEDDILDLIPGFIAKRKQNLDEIKTALESSDYEAVFQLAHKIKGSCRLYGFETLSEISSLIETASKNKDLETIEKKLFEAIDHIDRIKVEVK